MMRRLLTLPNLLRAVGILIVLYASYLMLRITLPFTALRPGIGFLRTKFAIYHIRHWRWSFYIHIFTAIPVLLCGLSQFSGYLIRRMPRLHRISGYIYVVDVLAVTGPAALVMSFYANFGWPARISFILQSLAWLYCTGLALRRALQRKFLPHGEWMLRSYAITLAAIMLRSYSSLLSYWHADLPPGPRYILISWASWVPNLIVAELIIRSGFVKRLLKKRPGSPVRPAAGPGREE